MRTIPAIIVAAAVLALGSSADATTIQGALRYGGLPVTATFASMTSGLALAYNLTSRVFTFGTLSIAGGNYAIYGLGPGSYQIVIRISPQEVGSNDTPAGGDLWSLTLLDVGAESTIEHDLDLGYSPHLTQPLDGNTTWPGSVSSCPAGTQVSRTFTVAWDPVPLATSYVVTLRHLTCSAFISAEEVTPATRSIQVTQQTVAGERELEVYVDAFEGSTKLTVAPYVSFSDGSSVQGYLFNAASVQASRPIHPSDAVFLAQVAHLPGVAPTFWKTDLFLTNLTASPLTATLWFTPRDVDGTTTYDETQVDLPAGATRTLTDVLGTLVGASGAGSLEVEPATVQAACRNYTAGTGPGFYGQGFVPIAADQTIWVGGPGQRLGSGGVARGAYRANLALAEVWGESANVRISLYDRNGSPVGAPKAVSLYPFGTTQINDVVAALGGPATMTEGQVTVDVLSGAGHVGAVLTLVDNGSNDPTTLPLVRR